MFKLKEFKKLTNNKWLNLFSVKGINKKGEKIHWEFVSRKEKPFTNSKVDAVIIVPIFVEGGKEKELVVTKEFRVPLMDYEYGFPSGLIDEGETIKEAARRELKEETGLDIVKFLEISNPVYSSAGLSDESCVIVFAKVTGIISNKGQEDTELIETVLMDIIDIKNLLEDKTKKIGGKAWGILWHYFRIRRIGI